MSLELNGEERDSRSSPIDVKQIVYRNSEKNLLIQKSLAKRHAELGPNGEFIPIPGSHIDLATDDKYVVHTESTEKKIWQDNNIKPMGEEAFETLYGEVTAYLHNLPELFITHRSIGKSDHYALNIEFLSEMPSAVLFTQCMFASQQAAAHDTYEVFHAPFFEACPFKYGTRSDVIIVISFEKKCVIIVGTSYTGEIKNSLFSVMNYLLPENGILPIHAAANQNSRGESFVFFGLCGTVKTALATDEGSFLIGDDEYGLSSRGLFNFEGDGSEILGKGSIPAHIFFLSADAFGVLPPISQLSRQQAVDYFILGYTVMLAEDEGGLKSLKATFSPCFGAPFILRHPMEYARLFAELVDKHKIQVWLLNTDRIGGPGDKGQQVPISMTQEIVRAIQNHELNFADFSEEPFFGLRIPNKIRDFNEKILNPGHAWSSKEEYRKVAADLKESFALHLGKLCH
jgi:phosphoenolpyruvate carboxykinase (ATP)